MTDSTNPTKYNFPYRTNYEAYLIATWLIAAVILFCLPYVFEVPKQTYWYAALACIVIGVVTGHKAFEIHIRKKRLKGYPLEFINPSSTKTLKMFGIDGEVIERVQRNSKK